MASIRRAKEALGSRLEQFEPELASARAKLRTARAAAVGARWVGRYPPGHYYSPIPSGDELQARADFIWRDRPELPGIAQDSAEQLRLLTELVDAQPVPANPRYTPDNEFYTWGDGIVLRGMLASQRPPRVVEVGSGWSSALVLDTRDALSDWDPELTFIEPYPDRLNSLLRSGDTSGVTIHEEALQDVDPAVFAALTHGDLLFIDSTHVSKAGSDVNLLLLDVIPSLAPGVLIHIHDVFWPFEYPREWLEEGRFWNEDYLLRALLTDNPSLQILLFNDWLGAHHRDAAAAISPDWAQNPGGSIWLRRRPA